MIRINLLEAEPRPGTASRGGWRMRTALAGVGIAAAAAGLVLWPALSVRGESMRLDERLRAADRELAGFAGVRARRDAAERQSAALARRVALAEALQAARGASVRTLDGVSRVLPGGVWLTELRQQGRDVAIEGRAAGMAGVSDLVDGLESSGHFVPPVEIVESRLEAHASGDVVRFELRVALSPPAS